MKKPKSHPSKDLTESDIEYDLNQTLGLPEGAIYMDYGIPKGPIWDKVAAFIGKERYIIHSFLQKGLSEELSARVNLALFNLENLKHEILVEIKDGTSKNILNLLRDSFKNAHQFTIEIQEFATKNGVQLNNESTTRELTKLYIDLDKRIGLPLPILNSELSKIAIKIRDEVENQPRLKTTSKSLKAYFENPELFDRVVKCLEMDDFVNITEGKIVWSKQKEGKKYPHRYLSALFFALDELQFIKKNKLQDQEIAEILSTTFNFEISKQVFSNAKNADNLDYFKKEYRETLNKLLKLPLIH